MNKPKRFPQTITKAINKLILAAWKNGYHANGYEQAPYDTEEAEAIAFEELKEAIRRRLEKK